MDSVSDRALTSGAEVVVHAYADGRAPGLDRVKSLGLDSVLCPASGTSEDVAVLLADELGARLIVAVGMRFNLVEFLDKGRPGMASAILTRMRVGDKIVEPKGVSRLYQSRISDCVARPARGRRGRDDSGRHSRHCPSGQIIYRFAGLAAERLLALADGNLSIDRLPLSPRIHRCRLPRPGHRHGRWVHCTAACGRQSALNKVSSNEAQAEQEPVRAQRAAEGPDRGRRSIRPGR